MRPTLCYNHIMNVRVKAYAKLNLALEITGTSCGYHNLKSLVCTVDLYDVIKLSKRKDGLVSVEMHGLGSDGIPFGDNNAVKAAESYIKRFSTRGADIKIFKNIPMGAGLGGSSADAAGVIRGMAMLYGLGSERELKELADSCGSDTGYMLTGGFAEISGRGNVITPLDLKTRLDFLLALPESGVSTAQCYAEWDKTPSHTACCERAADALLKGDKAGLGAALCNDLYAPAARLNGAVKEAYVALKNFAPLGVNMTGSGSGVYALFENAEFCEWAKSRYRGGCTLYRLKTVVPKL